MIRFQNLHTKLLYLMYYNLKIIGVSISDILHSKDSIILKDKFNKIKSTYQITVITLIFQ